MARSNEGILAIRRDIDYAIRYGEFEELACIASNRRIGAPQRAEAKSCLMRLEHRIRQTPGLWERCMSILEPEVPVKKDVSQWFAEMQQEMQKLSGSQVP